MYLEMAAPYPAIKILHEEYYSTADVHRILRGCSHLIGAMADMTNNWGPSGSLRTMATVGRPLICSRSLRASEVGAVLVESIDDITEELLEETKLPPDINRIGDGIVEYRKLIDILQQSIANGNPIRRFKEIP
jgi:hypothetical protein